MEKIFRYYLSGVVGRTVAQSQMFNWSELLEECGYSTTFIIFYSLKNKRMMQNMTKYYKGKCIKISSPNLIIIRDIIQFSILFICWLKKVFIKDKIIFQTRSTGNAMPLSMIRFLPKTRIIFDARGAGEEEANDLYKNQSKQNYGRK